MTEPDDMGFLAEDACRELAAAITHMEMFGGREKVLPALRRFMHEAKKTPPGSGQP